MKRIIYFVCVLLTVIMTGCSSVGNTGNGPTDEVLKMDVQEYITEILDQGASINTFENAKSEEKDGAYNIVCDVRYTNSEHVECHGEFHLTYTKEKSGWSLEKCRVNLIDAGYDTKNEYKIVFTANEDMSSKEYEEAIELLKGRVELLANGEAYELEMKEEDIELIISKNVFAGYDVEQIIDSYIARPTKLFFCNKDDAEHNGIEISRKYIENIQLEEGTVAGFRAANYGITESQYPYIEIQLSDSWMSTYGDAVDVWENGTLGQDMDSLEEYSYFVTVKSKESNTYYIINNSFDGQFSELLAHNLSNENYSDSFYYSVDNQGEGNKEPDIIALESPEPLLTPGAPSLEVYILPESNIRYYTYEELKDLGQEELSIARNEIFARHGRKFMKESLQEYFDAQSWYVPKYEPQEFDAKKNEYFNEYETENLEIIMQIEAEKGYR